MRPTGGRRTSSSLSICEMLPDVWTMAPLGFPLPSSLNRLCPPVIDGILFLSFGIWLSSLLLVVLLCTSETR
jgi:hypothetical protein